MKKFDDEVEISALKNENVEKLKQKIYDKVIKEEIDFNNLVLSNQRQCQILKEALCIMKNLNSNQTLDILGKITGKTENEDIIDLIFSKFCLGK